MSGLTLVPIAEDGQPAGATGALPDIARAVLLMTKELYQSEGYVEPWIGYLAVANGVTVGTCGFKAPPRHARVEMAYFTFPEYEGLGHASAMGQQLLALSRQANPDIMVAAQTLPERNASHRVLEKLGFRPVETLEHPEDGTVWEWRLDDTMGA